MKTIKLIWLTSVPLFLFTAIAFADPEAAVTTVSSIAVPDGSPWYATIIAAIFPILLGALTWLSGMISRFVATKLSEAKTSENGKWYAMAFSLAGIAVRAAEASYGPNTGKGMEKKAQAVSWLRDRLTAIDPSIVTKTPNIDLLLSGLVDGAYQDAFGALAPLAQPVQPKPVQ